MEKSGKVSSLFTFLIVRNVEMLVSGNTRGSGHRAGGVELLLLAFDGSLH